WLFAVSALFALSAGAWMHCSIYDPSLLLPAGDGGTSAESTSSTDGSGDERGGDDAANQGEGASDAAAPEAAASGCTRPTPPTRPPADDPPDAGDQPFSVALRSLDMGVRKDGSVAPLYGYDLDHVFTCCDASPESCEPPATGSTHCDEPGGRDNSGGAL